MKPMEKPKYQILETSGKWVYTHELMYSKFPEDRRRIIQGDIEPLNSSMSEKEEKKPIKGLFGGDNLHCRHEDIAKAEENERRNNPDELHLAVEGSQVVGVKRYPEPWNNWPKNENEQINFFLVNVLRLLNGEQAMILAKNILERLPSEPVVSQDQEERDRFAIGFSEWMMRERWYNSSTDQNGVTVYYQQYSHPGLNRVFRSIEHLLELYKDFSRKPID